MLSKHAAFPDDVSVQVKRKLPGQGADVLNLKDAGHVVTARLTMQPGAAFPWHTHPGPVIVTVTQGELTYQQASDCVERVYGLQDAFVDPGPQLHTAEHEFGRDGARGHILRGADERRWDRWSSDRPRCGPVGPLLLTNRSVGVGR